MKPNAYLTNSKWLVLRMDRSSIVLFIYHFDAVALFRVHLITILLCIILTLDRLLP